MNIILKKIIIWKNKRFMSLKRVIKSKLRIGNRTIKQEEKREEKELEKYYLPFEQTNDLLKKR